MWILNDTCDFVPEHYNDAHFSFYSILMLSSAICLLSMVWILSSIVPLKLSLSGKVMAGLDGQKPTSWFSKFSIINQNTEQIDVATASLVFYGAFATASACAFHYYYQFGAAGQVAGDGMCQLVYIAALPLYKPIQGPMLKCVLYLLTGISAHGEQQINGFSVLPVKVTNNRVLWPALFSIVLWYVVPSVVLAVPLAFAFIPIAISLVITMLVPVLGYTALL